MAKNFILAFGVSALVMHRGYSARTATPIGTNMRLIRRSVLSAGFQELSTLPPFQVVFTALLALVDC